MRPAMPLPRIIQLVAPPRPTYCVYWTDEETNRTEVFTEEVHLWALWEVLDTAEGEFEAHINYKLPDGREAIRCSSVSGLTLSTLSEGLLVEDDDNFLGYAESQARDWDASTLMGWKARAERAREVRKARRKTAKS